MSTFTITPQGPFELRESVEFGFGQRHATTFDGVMRLAFCADGSFEQVGVVVRQDADGVHGEVHSQPHGEADLDVVRRQVARLLSLDHDGTAYEEIGGRDPVIARLQQVRPGLRPPLFHSPYEAAVWAILSTRRPARQAARTRDQLAEQHGAVFELAGVPMAALPGPEQLLRVDAFPGVPDDRIPRLHAIARLALDGGLEADRLLALGPEAATAAVQRLPGIGPFYAGLIVIRGTGFVDVLPEQEPRLLELVARLYGDRPLAEIAEAWRPMRTGAAVMVRAAGERALAAR